MKSREEYLASIFSKRDALLAKRKKHLSQAAALSGITACITAAFLIVPDMTVNIDEVTLPEATSTNVFTESINFGGIFEPTSETAAENQTEKTAASSQSEPLKSETQVEKKSESEGNNNYQIEAIPEDMVEAAHVPEGTTKEIGIADGEPALAPADKPASETDDDSVPPESTLPFLHSSEDIIEEAKNCLTEDELDDVDADKTNALVSYSSDGEYYYCVFFYTKEKVITVTLDYNTLELIERGERDRLKEGERYTSPPWFPPGMKEE